MGDIYSPFIRLEQGKCYNLELTAGVSVCGCMCAHLFAAKEQKFIFSLPKGSTTFTSCHHIIELVVSVIIITTNYHQTPNVGPDKL